MDEHRNGRCVRAITPFVFTSVVLLRLLVADPALGQNSDPELQKFQGDWEVFELVENGTVIAADRIRTMLPSGGQLQVIETAIIFRSPKDHKQHAKVFSIGPTTYPKTIDIGDSTGGTSRGIYQFDQGRLVICMADSDSPDRPDQFSAEAGSQRMLMSLRRTAAPSDPASPKRTEPRPQQVQTPALKGLSDAEITRMLAGTWVLADTAGSLFVTFRPDGTFSTVREYQELRLFHKSFVQTPISQGTWSVKDGHMTAYVKASVEAQKVHRMFQFVIRSISAEDMIFVDPLGRVVRAPRYQQR